MLYLFYPKELEESSFLVGVCFVSLFLVRSYVENGWCLERINYSQLEILQ